MKDEFSTQIELHQLKLSIKDVCDKSLLVLKKDKKFKERQFDYLYFFLKTIENLSEMVKLSRKSLAN